MTRWASASLKSLAPSPPAATQQASRQWTLNSPPVSRTACGNSPRKRAPPDGRLVAHEASGLNDNIRDICGRFAAEGYAALGVDLFEGRNRAACMARMFAGGMAGNLDCYGVPALKAALGQLASHA